MKLQPMRFKNYIWPVNPESVKLEYGRNLQEVNQPLAGSALQDLGRKKRIVSGRGRFAGSTCMEEFSKLEALLAEGGSGVLALPGIKPFAADFFSLKMAGEPRPDCVAYEFVFLEDDCAQEDASPCAGGGTYVCGGGETLWSIANAYHTTVDRLHALNPAIQWPNDPGEGCRVVLP